MAERLVLLKPYGKLDVQPYEPAQPGPGQIQIKNHATSLNQLDWKRIAKNLFINSFPHVLGTDIAGHVVNAGSSSKFKEGDYVIAIGVPGVSDSCSFQTHVLVNENACAKISKNIPAKAVATLPFCLATAACGLYISCGLARQPSIREGGETTVLIWGANGSVGKLAIQLAKLSGYKVIAVTSTAQTAKDATARSADIVFNNDDPGVCSKIKSAAPDLQYAFDLVVAEATMNNIVQCVAPGGIITTATKYAGTLPEGYVLNSVFAGEISGVDMMGKESPRGKELGQWIFGNFSSWVEGGKITPLEFEDIGGLADIPTGLKRMQEGKAKGKLVAAIS